MFLYNWQDPGLLSLWVIVIVIIFARNSLCFQQQPSALLGFIPSCVRAHLQHTMLSSNSTIKSCRCCTLVFIEKQTLGKAKAISSKHTPLERNVLEVPFSVCYWKSGCMKSHLKTARQRGEKAEKVVCENLCRVLSSEAVESAGIYKLTPPRDSWICTRPSAHISVNSDLYKPVCIHKGNGCCMQMKSTWRWTHLIEQRTSETFSRIWPWSHWSGSPALHLWMYSWSWSPSSCSYWVSTKTVWVN